MFKWHSLVETWLLPSPSSTLPTPLSFLQKALHWPFDEQMTDLLDLCPEMWSTGNETLENQMNRHIGNRSKTLHHASQARMKFIWHLRMALYNRGMDLHVCSLISSTEPLPCDTVSLSTQQ